MRLKQQQWENMHAICEWMRGSCRIFSYFSFTLICTPLSCCHWTAENIYFDEVRFLCVLERQQRRVLRLAELETFLPRLQETVLERPSTALELTVQTERHYCAGRILIRQTGQRISHMVLTLTSVHGKQQVSNGKSRSERQERQPYNAEHPKKYVSKRGEKFPRN